MQSFEKRLSALERADRGRDGPAFVVLVPDDEGRLIGPDGRAWEEDEGALVIDLNELDAGEVPHGP